MKRRVVVTGLGAVTPVGNNVHDMWNSIKSGKNGITPITQFDTSNMKVKIAGEVKNLEIEKYLDKRSAKRLDRAIVLGLIAAGEAYQDANLENAEIDPYRFGTFVSSGIGGLGTINDESKKAHEKGGDRLSPFFIPNSIVNLIGGNIAIKYGAKGPAIPVVTACSAATNSIGEAFRYIRDGYCDITFAGGAEAAINELGVGGFTTMKALNTSNDVNNASIPFDNRRSGFVIAEGAGVIILEEYEHAKKRGAKIYGEMVGYGTTCDAFHITAPDETALGIANCIKIALDDANISPEQVDYINAHGTSTPHNDRLETLGIKKALGEAAYQINVSSTKSMTGHALGAIGGIEAIITVKAIENNLVPPTINYQEKDENCDLNYTPNQAVNRDINYAFSNSAGFGGQNACIVFKKFED
ncbi:beta-ketoacyl-ACP synthase II [Mycoplasmatota bacterium]|nr:beta-ketoacyl-ACP synthase II [Mycoplasmatota bacterium]